MSTPKSSSSLIPPDPAKVMVIRDVTPNITTLSVPFARFGHVKVGGRGTLVKLQTGNVAVFSPVALTPDVKSKVKSLGTIKYIVAPDIEHHIFLTPWAAEYPEAEIIGVEGLPEKRESNSDTKGTKFHHVFSAQNKLDMRISPEFDEEFSYEFIHSHVNKELVFLHKPSRTLIEADVLFNLPATEQYSKTGVDARSGILTKLFAGIMNTKGDMTWQKRFLWYAAGRKDRAGFAESAKRLKQWDYDRIIPCHGDVIETGGKRIMDEATAWFTESKR
ncbi:hypothetical protein A1O1_02446 [Capronia coronata CBS 617.96]|uniref:Metallo-beta-lactamase domain-containing protein n=1 Tax=Capronia coronata CBS 617.96 TaxID=1182541 RepID=W9YNC8_9EURO|nr:uncharacterized protein A1O1_02446 [Capronia coronata CBS 617.96]EXJ94053.1 hypothetical protein A1O1_02446 [Capronia coronata CBS 617.96]